MIIFKSKYECKPFGIVQPISVRIWNTKHASTLTTIQDHAGGSNNKSTFENYILTIVNPLLCCQTIRQIVRHRQSSMTFIKTWRREGRRSRITTVPGQEGMPGAQLNGRHWAPRVARSEPIKHFSIIYLKYILRRLAFPNWNGFNSRTWSFNDTQPKICGTVSLNDVPTPLSQWSFLWMLAFF